MGSPTKSPHIRAIWKISLEEASFSLLALTSLLKKSIRELCGGIEGPFSLLYLNALDMISQTSSECFFAIWPSTRWPDSSYREGVASSGGEKVAECAFSARSRIGLWSVPLIG